MAKNKYNARKVHAFGKKFDSQGEYKRAIYLMDCEKQGLIQNLEYQIPYKIIINDVKICSYIADFRYMLNIGFVKDGMRLPKDAFIDDFYNVWIPVVEDFKGVVTPMFKLKAKLVKACYDIDIKVKKKPTDCLN